MAVKLILAGVEKGRSNFVMGPKGTVEFVGTDEGGVAYVDEETAASFDGYDSITRGEGGRPAGDGETKTEPDSPILPNAGTVTAVSNDLGTPTDVPTETDLDVAKVDTLRGKSKPEK